MRGSLALLVAATLTLSSAPPSLAQQAVPERRVDSLFAQYAGDRPGLAVAVVRDGRVVVARGYGLADLEHRVPITPSTVFDVASVSKQFAGLAVAMLVEQGRVRLGDDIRKYIPELADVGHTVTVEQLVHHTSGYRDWPGTLGLAGWRYDDVISFAQILRFAAGQRTLNFVPGTEYTYSNTGYNLLAEMVRRVTGRSFREWTGETFFAPLGMTSSHFQDDHTRLVPNRAFGYARRPDGGWANSTDNLTALGSSSLFSTAEDLARWVMNFDDPKVGGPAAMRRMREVVPLAGGGENLYAFGLAHGKYRGVATLSHSGGWAGFSTFVLHVPEKRFGVVVLANTGSIPAGRAAHDLADLYLASELAPPQAPDAGGGPAPPATVAAATLDRYAGLYRLGPGWFVRIRRDGEVLRIQATREGEVPMTARSDTSFWVDAYSAAMVFRAPPGQPITLRYRGIVTPRLAESAPLAPAQLAALAGEYESPELETRYRVVVRDGTLTMSHPRHGPATLTRLWNDEFTGSAPSLRSVTFLRDRGGRVTGLSVTVDERSRDIRFARR
jgi:CubicO group peptidase (beta-lactamase class C family)